MSKVTFVLLDAKNPETVKEMKIRLEHYPKVGNR